MDPDILFGLEDHHHHHHHHHDDHPIADGMEEVFADDGDDYSMDDDGEGEMTSQPNSAGIATLIPSVPPLEDSTNGADWENLPHNVIGRVPPNWPINGIIAINIENRTLTMNATHWGDFNLTSDDRIEQKKIMFLMARAASSVLEIGSGTSLRASQARFDPMLSNGYFRCADSNNRAICIPRISVFLEALVNDSHQPVGWRFLFVEHDPASTMAESMYRIVSANRSDTSGNNTSGSNKRARAGPRTSVQTADCYRSICRKEHYFSACHAYFQTPSSSSSNNNNPFTQKALRTANPCFHDKNHPFNPRKIFGLEATMAVRTQRVCEDQKTLENYRQQGGEGLMFPKPHLVWNIPLFDCIPEQLHGLPIPRVRLSAPLSNSRPALPPVVVLDPTDDDYMDPGDDSSRHELEDRIERARSDEQIPREPTEEDLDAMGRHYWQGCQTSGDILDEPAGRPVSSFEKAIIDRSFLLLRRKKNEAEKAPIRSKYFKAKDMPVTNPARDRKLKEYRDEMRKWKETAICEWWEDMEYCDSEHAKISEVVKGGISFFRSVPLEQKYPERNMTADNLSTYGNMRLGIHEMMRRLYRFPNGRVSRRFYQLLLARTSGLTFSYGLHINIMLDGKSGLGKSYVLEALVEQCFPGSCDVATRVTKNAFNTGQDFCDRCLIIHEAPPDVIGIDEHGNVTIGDENIKSRLTSNVCKTYMCQIIKDPETGKVTRERILSFARCMGNMIVSTNARPPPSDHPLMQRFVRDIVMKTYKNTKFGVADIALAMNGEEDKHMNDLVTLENQILHIYEMFVEKSIEADVLDDINGNMAIIHFREILGRLSKKHEMPKVSVRLRDQMYKLARIAAIKHAIHLVYCTEVSRWRETSQGRLRPFDPLSLLDVERYLVITEEIAAEILTLFEDTFVPIRCQELILACKVLIPDPANPPFRRWKKANGDWVDDLNYVQFPSGSISQFCETISDRSGQKLSSDLVDRLLKQLRKEFMQIKDENVGPDFGKRKRICTILIEDDPDQGKRAKRISIAKQRLDRDFRDDALSECIQHSLCYNGCRPRRIITSLAYTREIRGTGYTKVYPNILGCIDICDPSQTPGKKGRILTFKNHMSYTFMDYATTYNRWRTGPKRTKLSMESPIIPILGDLEKITFQAHWQYIGAEYNPYYFPWEIRKLILKHRDENPNTYGGLIHLKDYPRDAVESQIYRDTSCKKLKETLKKLAEHGGGSMTEARRNHFQSCYEAFSGVCTGEGDTPIESFEVPLHGSMRRNSSVVMKHSRYCYKV